MEVLKEEFNAVDTKKNSVKQAIFIIEIILIRVKSPLICGQI